MRGLVTGGDETEGCCSRAVEQVEVAMAVVVMVAVG